MVPGGPAGVTCKDCKLPLSVEQTLKGDDCDTRIHQCACGSRWLSESRIVRRLQPTQIRGTGKANTGQIAGTSPPSSGGGVGGGLSEVSDQTPDSGPISAINPKRARARSTPPANYPSYFEAEWAKTARTGSKFDAFRAWQKLDAPAFGDSWQRWMACHEWRQDWFNYPHVSSWLNDGRYAQQPAAAKPKPGPRLVNDDKSVQATDAKIAELRRIQTEMG